MKTKIKATIHYDVYEDSYTEGEGSHVNYYNDVIYGDTSEDLLGEVAYMLNCTVEDLLFDNINDYDWASEFWWSFMCDADNNIVSAENDPELFKQFEKGKVILYVTHCHILVSKVTEAPLDLNEIKKLKVQI